MLALTAGLGSAQVTLFPAGSVWRYLDNGSDQGTAWRQRFFPDTTWTNGPAQLGFGDGDEARMINGGPPGARFITTYFRRQFTVANPSQFTGLWCQLLRDDGAVVYVNGVEVFRSNMPDGPVDYLTRAVNVVNVPEESAFYTGAFAPSVLFPGPNTIAVEVHQNDPASSDLSFDLALFGATNTAAPAVTMTTPTDPLMLPAGTNLFVAATASAPSSLIARVEFLVTGALRFADTVPPYEFTWGDLPAGFHALTAVAVEVGGGRATSAPVVVQVEHEPGFAVLVPNGAAWRYRDDGIDFMQAWVHPLFPDLDWPLGAAELGYGDGTDDPPRPEGTLIHGGPGTNRIVTTYFRHAFHVENPEGFTNLRLRVLRDDGVVVYLNGLEVFRDNLPPPPDPVLFNMLATTNAVDDGTLFTTVDIDPLLLQPGTNLIAAEVHQNSRTSTDVSFDLMLLAAPSGPPPDIQLQPQCMTAFLGTNVTFFVFALNATSYQWLHNEVPIPDATNATLTLSNLQTFHAGQYCCVVGNANGIVKSEPGILQLELSTVGEIRFDLIARDLLDLSGGGPGFWPASPPGCSPPIHSMTMGGSYGYNTHGATKVAGETNHCGIVGGHTMWSIFEAYITERVVLRTEGSSFDTVLAVYTWDGVPTHPLTPIVCDNDGGRNGSSRVEFLAVAGTIYYIAVDGVGGVTGYVRLQVGGLRLGPPVPQVNGDVTVFMQGRREQNRTYRLRASTNAFAPSNEWLTVLTTNISTNRPNWIYTYRTNVPPGRPRLFFNGQESP